MHCEYLLESYLNLANMNGENVVSCWLFTDGTTAQSLLITTISVTLLIFNLLVVFQVSLEDKLSTGIIKGQHV